MCLSSYIKEFELPFQTVLCLKMLPSVLSLLVIGSSLANAARVPNNWQLCRRGDQECLRAATESAMRLLKDGNKGLGVFPLDPFHFNQIGIEQGTGPVSVKLLFTDMDLVGMSNVVLESMEGGLDGNDIILHSSFKKPLSLNGHYDISGKVLILPISGRGNSSMVFDNFHVMSTLKMSKFNKGGEEYLNVDRFDIDITADKVAMQFDNLFDGNEALGENMNKFLNDNWEEILKELKPAISEAFGTAFADVSNRVFHRIPIRKLVFT